MHKLFCLFFCLVCQSVVAQEHLAIDPLLIKQAEAVWRVIAADDNPVWPGWNASDTPILFYLPDEQDVLINHPSPPADFSEYTGPVRFGDNPIFVRTGKTHVQFDGQNTSLELFGTPTLVVADTLSNRRNNFRGTIQNPASNAEKVKELTFESLRADPYSQMALIAHEAFHVFQMRELNHEYANKLSVKDYPCLSVKNNVGIALEADALYASAQAVSDGEFRSAAIRWLALRRDRRKVLSPAAIEYEDRNEFIEGLAKYVEYRLMEVLEGTDPQPELWLAQGFDGFDDLSKNRINLLEKMKSMMRGEINVNNDLYGTAPVRFRLYFSGMGIALLLDRIEPNWKSSIAESNDTLTSLVAKALDATEAEIAIALAEAQAGPDYQSLVETKEKLAHDGKADTEKMLAAIESRENSVVVIDYSDLKIDEVGLAFTPFGVRRVDEHRVIYSMVPISGKFSDGYTFQQTSASNLLQDSESKQIKTQLTKRLAEEEIAKLAGSTAAGPWQCSRVEFPGLTIDVRRAEVSLNGNEIYVKLLR